MACVYKFKASDSDIVSAANKVAHRLGYSLRAKQKEIIVQFVK